MRDIRARSVTIRDVAREAGVGVGTVSRVLSGSPRVGDGTREVVNQVIDRLGYRPSHIARSLAKGTTGAIGVVTPFFMQHYFQEVMRGIQARASESDYSLVVHSLERQEQLKALSLEKLRDRVDGLIVVAIEPGELAGAVPQVGLPVVGVDTELRGAVVLRPDHEAGLFLAARHLIGHGHKRLALLDRPHYPVSGNTIPARRNGFWRACREAGLDEAQQVIETTEYSPEGGYAAARALLARPAPPSAFACASDVQAIGVLRAFADEGLSLGREAAVSGYDDVDLARYACVTSVHVPAYEMGLRAVQDLLAAMARPDEPPPSVVFRPTLTVRASCGCADESRLFGWPGYFPSTGPGPALDSPASRQYQ